MDTPHFYSVTNMEQMFKDASSFNQSIGDWNVSTVTTMSLMFFYASDFNQNIGDWDVSSVSDMYGMLYAVTLSQSNYDALLKGWSALSLNSDLYFSVGDSTYCDEDAREILTDTYKWYIDDGGIDSDCDSSETVSVEG